MPAAPLSAGGRGKALPDRRASPRRRRSRTAQWRALVLLAIHGIIALHIAHWLSTGETLSPVEPSEAMELAKRGTLNAGAIFFLAAIAVTAVFGRFFCGWGCHLVALQDLSRWLLEKAGIRPVPLRSRLLLWVPAAAFLYMFAWPLLARHLAGLGWPTLHLELTTRDFWATFPDWPVALATFLVCGFFAVYLLGAKGFCTYACPYGAAFAWADRFARGRIVVSPACEGSGHCTATCTSNVRVHEEIARYGQVVDPGCMKCLDCVSVCPNGALSYGRGLPLGKALKGSRANPPPRRGPEPLPWREELVLACGFLGTFFALRGLYGVFPFLFSLGLGACGAFLALVTYRLFKARHLALRTVPLKRNGTLLHWGRTFLAFVAAGSLFLLHSLVLQGLLVRGGWLELRSHGGPDPAGRLRAARQTLERADRWSLLPQPGLRAALARLAYREGDLAGLEEILLRALGSAGRWPGDAEAVLEAYADLARAHGQKDRALRAYDLWIELRPQTLRAHAGRIQLLAERGELEAARAALERARAELGAPAEPSLAELERAFGAAAPRRSPPP